MPEHQLEMVSAEIRKMMFRREYLLNRLRILNMLKEFGQNGGLQEVAEKEKESIQEELEELSKQKRQLQQKLDTPGFKHLRGIVQDTPELKHLKGDTFTPVMIDGSATSSCDAEIFFVEPPSYPAPQVILDITKLPPYPSPTRCPYCEQFVITELITSTGNTAWLVCLVCAFLGCVAGCCLIPFCVKNYKDVVHKCPKCRSCIHTCTKL